MTRWLIVAMALIAFICLHHGVGWTSVLSAAGWMVAAIALVVIGLLGAE